MNTSYAQQKLYTQNTTDLDCVLICYTPMLHTLSKEAECYIAFLYETNYLLITWTNQVTVEFLWSFRPPDLTNLVKLTFVMKRNDMLV